MCDIVQYLISHYFLFVTLKQNPDLSILCLADLFKHFAGLTVNTSPFNYTGHPALSLNMGYSEELPVGGTIVGKKFEETKVLQVGYALEQQLKQRENMEK